MFLQLEERTHFTSLLTYDMKVPFIVSFFLSARTPSLSRVVP